MKFLFYLYRKIFDIWQKKNLKKNKNSWRVSLKHLDTLSVYAANASIDDKKAQRILKKLVDAGLVETEGIAKATEYVVATINTIDE